MAKFNWKAIVGTVAPTLASALGGPLAGMAVNAVSKAVLGKTGGTEKEIAAAISQSEDPALLTKLKEVETSFAEKMKELDVDFEEIAAKDRANARQREIAVGDWTPSILAYGYTLGYFAVLYMVMTGKINPEVKDLVSTLFGVLSAAQVGIISYYFGSSAGSSKKNSMLQSQLNNKS